MIFDTILFDLDDTIHDRNRTLCKLVDLFISRYCDVLDYNSKLIVKDIFLKLITKDISPEKKYLESYRTESHGNINLI